MRMQGLIGLRRRIERQANRRKQPVHRRILRSLPFRLLVLDMSAVETGVTPECGLVLERSVVAWHAGRMIRRRFLTVSGGIVIGRPIAVRRMIAVVRALVVGRMAGVARLIVIRRTIVVCGLIFIRLGILVVPMLMRCGGLPMKRIRLADQAGKLGERIAAVIVGGRLLTVGIARPVAVIAVVRHYEFRVRYDWGMERGCGDFTSTDSSRYRISSGASTPNKANPEAITVKTPCTRASRDRVSSRSSWIMKRK